MASNDEISLLLNSISRAHYSSIRNSIHQRTKLSISITASELADVVNGREDVNVPSWAGNSAFEKELEQAIREHQIVWICVSCDRIISFYRIPEGMSLQKYVAGLMAELTREKTACPFCHDERAMLFKSDFLTTGEYVPPWNRLGKLRPDTNESDSIEEEKKKAFIAKQNHDHTIEIMSKYFNEKGDSGESAFAFSRRLSDLATDENPPPSLEGDNSLISSLRTELQNELSSKRKEDGDYILGLDEKNNKTLARVWSSICEMLRKEWPDIDKTDLRVARKMGLSSQVFRGDANTHLIVLDFDLFSVLYSLNALSDRILFRVKGVDEIAKSKSLLLNALNRVAENNEDDISVAGTADSFEDLLRSHFLGTNQHQFMILHELGHVALWDQRGEHGRECGSVGDRSVMEFESDEWAIRKIIEKGGQFNPPFAQHLAIFLLFEYWNGIYRLTGPTDSSVVPPRRRWDAIYLFLGAHNADSFAQGFISDTRALFDSVMHPGTR